MESKVRSKEIKPVSTGNARLDKIFNSGMLNRTVFATQLFSTNKIGASQYLYKKLHRLEGQSFNKNDTEKSLKIIDYVFNDNCMTNI